MDLFTLDLDRLIQIRLRSPSLFLNLLHTSLEFRVQSGVLHLFHQTFLNIPKEVRLV